MLWTLAIILLVLWLVAVVASFTAGGLIHLLLLVALGFVLTQMIVGHRRVA